MNVEPYCRLYIQSELSKEKLRELFLSIVEGELEGFTIVTPSFYADVRNNIGNDFKKFQEEKDFIFSSHTAEIEPLDSQDVDIESYIQCVCSLITELRKAGMLVTAACEFEDVVAARTGWNWTDSSREHPQLEVG